ncbi:hypothetical protein GCM10010442_16900 [Kitasatospora kifunensis]|uniref:ADP-ribosylglycohydrolase n=1 Tax=Kitasatospora kifunensis TaxID=58351 RepID=A0A7W7R6M3_KITKI|nr:ADP-ribosylglycohydrolase [Kitasatospora kifunensis]
MTANPANPSGTPIHDHRFDHRAAARDCLRGLATGDAFGAQFFVPANLPALRDRHLPPSPWPWTDDTEMACSVFAALRDRGTVNSYELVHSFAKRHDFDRGYGAATNRLLRLVREGGNYRKLAADLFDGQGSWGNGAAMRVAPLGAWYAADPAEAAWQAARSAEVTHTHPEAVAGAIAVALAAAWAARARVQWLTDADLLAAVLELTPPSRVRDGIAEARQLLGQDAAYVAQVLGNGRYVSAIDTVPFALWCAARHLRDYSQALWTTAGQGGDVDTTCAIVGGIVAANVGTEGIPPQWREATEQLPEWVAEEQLGADLGPADFPRHTPMKQPEPIPVPQVVLPPGQWQRIRHGVASRAMEERWQSYLVEAGDHLLIFRNSLNHPLYDVGITHTPQGPRPTAAWVEGAPPYRRRSDVKEAAFLEWLLDALFGRDRRELWDRYMQLASGS